MLTKQRIKQVFSLHPGYVFLIWSIASTAGPSHDSDLAIALENGWIRHMPPSAQMLAGYGTLTNPSNEVIHIVSAKSEHFALVELHRTVETDGQYRMREVPELEIPAGGHAELVPGGLHLMLMQPVAPLNLNDDVIIHFETSAGTRFAATLRVQQTGHD